MTTKLEQGRCSKGQIQQIGCGNKTIELKNYRVEINTQVEITKEIRSSTNRFKQDIGKDQETMRKKE